MRYHVVLSRPFDLEAIALEAQADKRPRHTMWTLAQSLGAQIHEPKDESITFADKMLAKVTGASGPQHWAMARRLAKRFTNEDVVFCIGEDSGFPLATLCGNKPNRPKISVFLHNVDRPRGKMTLKLFGMRERIDLFMTNTTVKAECLSRLIGLPKDRIYLLSEQTDTQFFTPGEASPGKKRPVIGSGGLEQRDYRTLAAATHDLDVDVKICAVSPNASKMADTFPEEIPQNMSVQYYNWTDLRQLYRDADVMAISLKAHNYQAGFTTLFESLSCRRPVVMTRTPGFVEELADAGIIIGVQPGDAAGMRKGILNLLNNPQEAAAQAQRGYDLITKHYNSEQYVSSIVEQLELLTLPEAQLVFELA
jgi:glycosyltransferase involved in cell wall biosynthesis